MGNGFNKILPAAVHADNFCVIPGHLQLLRKINKAADTAKTHTFTIRQLAADSFGKAEKAYVPAYKYADNIFSGLAFAQILHISAALMVS